MRQSWCGVEREVRVWGGGANEAELVVERNKR